MLAMIYYTSEHQKMLELGLLQVWDSLMFHGGHVCEAKSVSIRQGLGLAKLRSLKCK